MLVEKKNRIILFLGLCMIPANCQLDNEDGLSSNVAIDTVGDTSNTTLEGNLDPINATAVNTTLSNTTSTNNATSFKPFACSFESNVDEITTQFQIVNSTTLMSILKNNPNITLRTQPAPCQVILFYAPWCPFSIQAAPHLNALPRGFPMLNFFAIDAHAYNSFSIMHGVMAIPSLFLFHNGKAAARYNETEYKIDLFGAFITKYTSIAPIGILNRTSADYQGPLPTVVMETTDPWLIFAWVFLCLSIMYWFTKSHLFWTLVENLRNTWREAEAQHEHVE